MITNTATSRGNISREELGSFINAYVADPACFHCSCCTLDKSPDECLCDKTDEATNSGCGPLWLKLQELQQPPERDYRARLTSRENVEIIGDFLDPTASANDPVFLFHHANVDRNWQKWLDYHLLRADGTYKELHTVEYLKYPRSGLAYGNNLDDPFGGGENFQFSNLFGHAEDGEKAFTVREALERSYNQTVYIYDSLDLQYALDASMQNPLQGQYLSPSPVSRTISDSTIPPSRRSQRGGKRVPADSGIQIGNLIVSPMLFTFLLSGILSVAAVLVSFLIKRRVV